MDTVSLADLKAEHFSPHVDSSFTLTLDDGTEHALTLTDVGRVIASAKREPFSLHFLGTPGRVLPQRMYRIAHPGLGAMDLFIVPIGASQAGTQYEAIFA